jgi:hypothetical protein
MIVPTETCFYVGEKPPATLCEYVDKDKALVSAPITGATLTAETWINDGSQVDVTVTNNDDGTFDIDWPIGANPSHFTAAGTMKIRIKVVIGDYTWYIKPVVSVPIYAV